MTINTMDESALRAHIAATNGITEADILPLFSPDEKYPTLADFLFKQGVVTPRGEAKRFVARAMREAKIRHRLGTVPRTSSEFLNALMSNCNYTLDVTSQTPLAWVSPRLKTRSEFDQDECFQFLTYLNRNLLDNQFKKPDLGDELAYWVGGENEKLRKELFAKLDDRSKAISATDWEALADTVFEPSGAMDRDLQIACIKKFIWQVKRKMTGRKVTDHLMICFYGSQGCGKSELVKRMCASLSKFFALTNFEQVVDDRQVELHRNYVLFLDEMGRSAHTDIEELKSVITRDVFNFRPMNTNQSIPSAQRSTFIGTANKTLGELIKDTTGNRRFAQIDVKRPDKAKSEFAFVNAFDFTGMWCSVDPAAQDPMTGFEDKLAKHQSNHANKSSVMLFLEYVWGNKGRYLKRTQDGSSVHTDIGSKALSKETLHDIYRQHCTATSSRFPLELQAFTQELNRLKDEDDCPFEKTKTGGLMKWCLSQDLLPQMRLVK